MSPTVPSTRLFSYVVEHDNGNAPCVSADLCSLAVCKYSKSGRPNIAERVQVGDWVVGTGGATRKSAGHGRLVYAMRVTAKVPLAEYLHDPRYQRRQDVIFAKPRPFAPERVAVLSDEFWYFGANAPDISRLPWNPNGSFEKRGPGFRNKFSAALIAEFERWLRAIASPGVHGIPCQTAANQILQPWPEPRAKSGKKQPPTKSQASPEQPARPSRENCDPDCRR